jgi:hypothetical protein
MGRRIDAESARIAVRCEVRFCFITGTTISAA